MSDDWRDNCITCSECGRPFATIGPHDGTCGCTRPKVLHQEDIDRAGAEERARIVAQLRERAELLREGPTLRLGALSAAEELADAADRIERGES